MQKTMCAADRRQFLKGLCLAAVSASLAPLLPRPAFAADATPEQVGKKPLVVYFLIPATPNR